MKLNLGLDNRELYAGCETTEVGGRLALVTPPAEAVNIVGRNANRIVDAVQARDEITLTGPMAVWAYLAVFHIVVHRFNKVWYNDGRNDSVLIAQH